MVDSPDKLVLGLVTGVLFGFLLQKGRVAKFETILGQLLLKDWTVAKVMATAVVVGSVGVHFLVANGWASMHVKPFFPAGVLLGALAFGVGMAVYGYCPGTGVAACGEGNRDAMAGVAGMLAGAGAFVALFPSLHSVMYALGDQGAKTLPEIVGVSPWLVIAAMAAGVLIVLTIIERWTGDRRMPTEFSSTHRKPVAG